ncbi:LacI family transcriptional regulator [Oscillospiraceae bacterium OttesenSCG-928-F05]|nr:LacI family transcriptional regulator [Oscillospiraceae bacterium OttesenSCG-928-F05]
MSAPTIKTIAKAANVSTATVSKVLNDMPDISQATKARVRNVCKELGYVPNAHARRLSLGRNNTIGVILADITDPLNSGIYKALCERMYRYDFALYLSSSGGSAEMELNYVQAMMQNGVAALIVLPVSADVSHIQAAVGDMVPVIYLSGKADPARGHYVANNDYSGAQLAAQHLHALGHRHIDMFAYSPVTPKRNERIQGYSDFMRQHGLKPNVLMEPYRGDLAHLGKNLARRVLTQSRMPTAVFACNDLVAIGAMAAFRTAGVRVPEDISVVGFEDIPASELPLISLTSVRQPGTELGICAADMAAQLAAGRTDIVTQLVLEPHLVVRTSTAHLLGHEGR